MLELHPGAAFIRDIRDGDAYVVGVWVRAYPDLERWPKDADPPTVALGQVIERRDDWARIELLAVTDVVRTPLLTPQPLDNTELPSLTKRVLPVQQDGQALQVPAGDVDLVTGEEVYAILPPAAQRDDHRRFPARFAGLARLEPMAPHTSRIKPLSGRLPRAGDILVLLDLQPPSPLRIEIVVAQGPEAWQTLSARLMADVEVLLQAHRIGDVTLEQAPIAARELRTQLNAPVEDTLRIFVTPVAQSVPDTAFGLRVISQINRVTPEEPTILLPTTLSTNTSMAQAAEALVIHALQMRGEHARASVLMEQRLQKAPKDWTTWAQLTPSLISAYRQLDRPDWALELFFALQSLADQTPEGITQPPPTLVHAALALDSPDFSDPVLDAAIKRWPKSQWTAPLGLALWRFMRHHHPERVDTWRARFNALSLTLSPEMQHEHDLLVLQSNDPESNTFATTLKRARALAKTLGPLAELDIAYVELITRLERDLDRLPVGPPEQALEALVAFTTRANTLGAPATIYPTLLDAALALRERFPQISGQLLRFTAQAALRARRFRDMVRSLDAYANLRRKHPLPALPEALTQRYVRALATLDHRNQLGLRSLPEARERSDADRARQLLTLARALFYDTGDPVNVAVADFNRARLELKLGHTDSARRFLARGRRFEVLARHPPLTAFRQNIEAQLNEAAP